MDTETTATTTTTASPEASGIAASPATPTSSHATEGSLLGGTETKSGATETTSASSTAGTSWVNEKGEFSEGWLDRLPEDFKDSKQILGQFKDINGALKTLVNQQKLLGKKAEAVLIPKDDASPEEVAAFRAKLGVPDNVDAYPTKPKDLPQGLEWNEGQAKEFNALAHKLGITPAQAEQIMAFDAQRAVAQAQEAQIQQKQEFEQARKTLADAWGDRYETNKAVATRMAQSLGLDPNTKGLSDPAVVIALERAARMVSDDKIVSSDVSATMMAGKARAMDIMTNPQNPLYAKYQKGDKGTADLVFDLLQHG
jgi:ElaB/YqjD/DUF883 family membrane-anchored ribosome-binding protein